MRWVRASCSELFSSEVTWLQSTAALQRPSLARAGARGKRLRRFGKADRGTGPAARHQILVRGGNMEEDMKTTTAIRTLEDPPPELLLSRRLIEMADLG
jgi:hypothetical protein